MTTQFREILYYKGRDISMVSQPLNQYLVTRKDIKFVCKYTACWRGYYGTWTIKDNKLYLTDLHAYIRGYEVVGLDYLFPGQETVFAEWFTGDLIVPEGEFLGYGFMEFDSIYEKDIILNFKNGLLEVEYEKDNHDEYKKMKIKEQEIFDQLENKNKTKSFWKKLFNK